MSRIFYIITKMELPFRIAAHSRLADFSLQDITKYIKDANVNFKNLCIAIYSRVK